jgi:hypothetical protein
MTENQALPGVKVEIGGEEYTILFSLYAFAKLKKVIGINALKGEVDFYDPDHLLYFLWAGLITCHPDLDGELIEGRPDKQMQSALRKLGSQLTLDKMSKLGAAIRKAFSNATQSGESKAVEEPEIEGKKT